MIEIAATLEATGLAQVLKASRWIYPLVNAGHIFGIALLVGAVVPMDVAVLRGRTAQVALLRGWSAAGFAIAALFGSLLFVTQATDYVGNGWFLAKVGVIVLAVLNALAHFRLERLPVRQRRQAATASLALWPAALILGRMVGYA